MLLASAVILGGCGGGGDTKPPASGQPATQTPPLAATEMPITGDTHTVKMIVEGGTVYKFDPVDVTIKSGDGIKYVVVSGQPHNVRFPPMNLPPDVKAQLNANMKGQTAELQSPPLMNPGDFYIVSFGGVKPGKYEVDCPLHLMFSMKGTVTVQ